MPSAGLRAWLALATSPAVRGRALRTSAVVGTLLNLINHGGELLQGRLGEAQWLQIALTYLVPYCVATWASVQAMRQMRATTTTENS